MRRDPLVLLFLAVLLAAPVTAKESAPKLYRWVDQQGKVHYSDTIPAEAAYHKRIIYDKTQVRKLKVVEKPKTKEELAREARLAQLREEEKRLLEEQLAKDRALLRTYRSEEDLQLALKGQLNTIDARIRVLEANIQRLQTLLKNKIAKAAEIERNGRKVPMALARSIASLRSQIHRSETKITHEEQAKEALHRRFARDLKRFRRLQTYFQQVETVATIRPDTLVSAKQRILLNVAHCRPDTDCNRAWQLARIYVQTHATTPLFIDSDTILHTQDPRREEDIALTVARIHGERKDTLFLDVRCKLSKVGQELCHSDQVREMRTGFPAFIESGLKASSPQ